MADMKESMKLLKAKEEMARAETEAVRLAILIALHNSRLSPSIFSERFFVQPSGQYAIFGRFAAWADTFPFLVERIWKVKINGYGNNSIG